MSNWYRLVPSARLLHVAALSAATLLLPAASFDEVRITVPSPRKKVAVVP